MTLARTQWGYGAWGDGVWGDFGADEPSEPVPAHPPVIQAEQAQSIDLERADCPVVLLPRRTSVVIE